MLKGSVTHNKGVPRCPFFLVWGYPLIVTGLLASVGPLVYTKESCGLSLLHTSNDSNGRFKHDSCDGNLAF
jgi:hypothetical protein